MFQNKLMLQYQLCIISPICLIISGFGSEFSFICSPSHLHREYMRKHEKPTNNLSPYSRFPLEKPSVMNLSISLLRLMEPTIFPTQKLSSQLSPHFCTIPTVLSSQLCLGLLSSLSSSFNNHILCKFMLLSHGGNMASSS